MTPEDPAYLRHILDAIISIEEFSEGISSVEDLRCRRLERAGIERMLTIIGEAAKRISPELLGMIRRCTEADLPEPGFAASDGFQTIIRLAPTPGQGPQPGSRPK
ncbi:DUF86 domain-containing protein [Methanoculleus sp. UBA416]|jgi:hypothetical protein|uniref:HepT-like ribonuclease domain-containing protein n=1 Tax=Methanoculleus sp. UBA416 TaxID=1915510 RepID=UPI00319DAF14